MDFAHTRNTRYLSQIPLTEIGPEGQIKLRNARILVVGAGGLGCPVLQYLTAAGVGIIGIIDGDHVGISNLNRQILYNEQDIGKLKVQVAREKLISLNSEVQIEIFPEMLDVNNAQAIIQNFDIVVDCTDNLEVRYLIDDVCTMLKIPMIYGALHKFQGQVSVFHYPDAEGKSYSYRDLFPENPAAEQIPSCAETGVLGVMPGIIGTIQAAQALKIILGFGEILIGKLFIFDVKHLTSMTIEISKRNNSPRESIKPVENSSSPGFEVNPLEEFKENENGWIFIDIREPDEIPTLGLSPFILKLPAGEFGNRISELPDDKKHVLFCTTGKRSLEWVKKIRQNPNTENIYSLKGGIQRNSALFNLILSRK